MGLCFLLAIFAICGVFGATNAEGKAELFAPSGSLEIKAVKGDEPEGAVRISAPEGARIEAEVLLGPVHPRND